MRSEIQPPENESLRQTNSMSLSRAASASTDISPTLSKEIEDSKVSGCQLLFKFSENAH